MKLDPGYWTARRVCVTGGTGFLGFHLVRRLLDMGASVRIFAMEPAAGHPLKDSPDVECFWGDVRDPQAVKQAVSGCDIVFHTAGTVAVWGPALKQMHEIHVAGTQNVLRAAGQARVVHTSSLVAVGGTKHGTPLSEEADFPHAGLKIDYVHAKRDAEEVALAAAAGQDVVVTNPGYLVGPEDFENSVMGRFCVRTWTGNMAIAPPGGWDLVDVRDVAIGHMLAAEKGAAGRRYLLGGENLTVKAFIQRLAAAGNMRPRMYPKFPISLVFAAALVAESVASVTRQEPYPSFQHVRLNRYHWYGDSSRARSELGFAPRPLDESLRDTFAWYQEQNRLPLNAFGRWWMRPNA